MKKLIFIVLSMMIGLSFSCRTFIDGGSSHDVPPEIYSTWVRDDNATLKFEMANPFLHIVVYTLDRTSADPVGDLRSDALEFLSKNTLTTKDGFIYEYLIFGDTLVVSGSGDMAGNYTGDATIPAPIKP